MGTTTMMMRSVWILVLVGLVTAASETNRKSATATGHTAFRPAAKKSLPSVSTASAIPAAVTETLQTDESKYSKTEVVPGPLVSAPHQDSHQSGDYAELGSYESFKYATAPQHQHQHQASYDNQDSSEDRYESQPPRNHHQYYVQEGRASHDYDSLQQLKQSQLYQQEAAAAAVVVGNHLQSSQQKAAAQKYVVDGSDDKGTYYVNIPMSQLLAYYKHYGIPQTAGQNEPQISVPVHMAAPFLAVAAQSQVYAPQKQVTSYPEYVTAYPKHTQAVISKSSKLSTASGHQHTAPSASIPSHQLPISSHHQPRYEILMNSGHAQSTPSVPSHIPQTNKFEYYVTHQQLPFAHQQQQFSDYAVEPEQDSMAYSDVYNTPGTAYVQDNSIYEQQQPQQHTQPQIQHQPQHHSHHGHNYQQHSHQQQYVPTVADQLMLQFLQQTGIQSPHEILPHPVKPQHQHEVHEQLQQDFIPPQYQAQKFRDSHDVSNLVPEAESFPKSHFGSQHTAPKTLLDSYVPSHIIAAQDANRYRERPIKLESGFLPSKINFVRSYKKRKGE